MKKDKITQELLNKLEQKGNLNELQTIEDFERILKLNKAILYFTVNWSGPEKISRYIIFSIFIEFNNKETPVYIIDCSDQNKKYIKDWLIRQRENKNHLYYGGLGETLLIKNGEITDYILNPA